MADFGVKPLIKKFIIGTFDYDVPQNGAGMKMKCIFNEQLKNDFTRNHKCRIVICGYSQIKGLNYNETYSPTSSTVGIMLLLLISCIYEYHRDSIDFTSAFTLVDNDFDNMYAFLPTDLTNGR